MNTARLYFQKGDYAGAQSQCEKAIEILPGDANLHEFLALSEFARSKYQDAASTLRPILAAGADWEWRALGSYYANVATYTVQLRALERYVRENPTDASGRFVLAYHYLVLANNEAAIGQLCEIVKLEPNDDLSRAILGALETRKDDWKTPQAKDAIRKR
jgi:tetratricopeptide (TPR) repeat protein